MKCYFCAILNQMCKNRMEQEHQFIDYIEQSIIKNWDKDALTDYKGSHLLSHYHLRSRHRSYSA